MRQPSEVSPPIRGVKILNPVFDITPWKYVRAIITEQGIFKPARLAAMARRRK
jgi:translation initiation factor 2B subunit (eIF-2B alpha/beta/delta family)